ncbi:hypothetical protein MRBLMI12_000445 [Microbacterium sp. LMI12-1-1.1]|uniref:hypothetical protein n=1 Tax=Microbacterium sp. LMI12-1-1.1 TaxID=3135225 RepID=UPI003420A92F
MTKAATIRNLESQLDIERGRRLRAEARLGAHGQAADILTEELGFEEVERTLGPQGDTFYGYKWPKGFRAFTAETWAGVKKDHESDVAAAVEATRRETLEKVIDALELKEYGARRAYFTIEAILRDGDSRSGADRFWSDIETTLAERQSRKDAEARAAQERRIAALKKPEGGIWLGIDPAASLGDPITFFYPKENGCDIKRPEKASQGNVGPVAGTAKPAKKAAKAKKGASK